MYVLRKLFFLFCGEWMGGSFIVELVRWNKRFDVFYFVKRWDNDGVDYDEDGGKWRKVSRLEI